MPKYQKLSEQDGVTEFIVYADDGSSEKRSSICIDGETEDQMMSRVANHHNDELKKLAPAAEIPVANPEPIKDAIPNKDLPVVD